MKRLLPSLVVILAAAAALALAQAPSPPPPAKYQATLRYRIIAPRDQHVVFYDRLIQDLLRLGFEFQPPLDEHPPTDRLDPSKNTLRGLLPSANVARARRLPHVAGLLLVPEGQKLPEQADAPVRVRIEVSAGLPYDRQHDLWDQAKLILKELGFREALAYDHRGVTGQAYTRLSGVIPVGQLEVLVKDLREQPGGWFAPRISPAGLPAPLRQVEPLRWIEVLSDAEPIRDVAPPAARTPAALDKIGPRLWEVVAAADKDEQQAGRVIRVQVLVAGTPRTGAALQLLAEEIAPGAFVEGVLGNIISAEVQVGQVKTIAALPNVIGVRLPPAPRVEVDPKLPAAFEPAKALAQSGIAALHERGRRGQGARLAVLDADFRGWDTLVKEKKLPGTTRLIDLTAERSPQFLPAPPLAGNELGHGTQVARAAALAAPDADLVLVRLDGFDHFQIDAISRYLAGGLTSPTLQRRLDELRIEDSVLDLQRSQLQKERQAIVEDFRDETDLYLDFGFLGPMYGWLFSERAWHRQRLDYQVERERDLADRERRYWDLIKDVQSLKGIGLVVLPYAWNDGYPLGGASPLSRALDAPASAPVASTSSAATPSAATSTAPSPLWFVPTGNTAGQSWHGMFRDADRNGVMEFADLAAPLPKGVWTPELNFLAWQPHGGKRATVLPAKTRLRIALQWREPHDPDYYLRPGEDDWYRQPLADLRLVVLRQRDPEAKAVGADAFEVVARSPALPSRLDHQPTATVYEQILDWTVDKPGRYAVAIEHTPPTRWELVGDKETFSFLRLEDLKPSGIRPLGAPTLPGVERKWELAPRLFVDALDDASRRQGRPLLGDFATAAGSIGVPADAHSVIAVGAADLNAQPQPYSAAGSPLSAGLVQRPTVYATDALREGPGPAWGTSLSAGHAAGVAATLLSSGVDRLHLQRLIEENNGKLLRAPR
jgi:hypothetical protein